MPIKDIQSGDGAELEFSGAILADSNAFPLSDDASLFQPPPTIEPALPINGGDNFALPLLPDLHLPVLGAHGHIGGQVVFVDPGVGDLQTLLASIKPGMGVVLLDPHRDALDQIAETLRGYHDITAVHIIADGRSGQIDFSSGAYDLGNLTTGSHGADLSAIGQALSPNGDLMIWSCDTGAGAAGQAFIDALAQQTGADVAASTNLTGAGGNWVLEAHTGPIEATVPLTSGGIHQLDTDGLNLAGINIIYPETTYTPPTPPASYGPSDENELGISYGSPGDNVVGNLFPGTFLNSHGFASGNSSDPSDFTQLGSKVVFTATSTDGRQLWITDGTTAGTHELDDINPGSNAFFGVQETVPRIVIGTELYFDATTTADGIELWKTDGTAGGTMLVDDIRPGAAGSGPFQMVDLNGTLFFVAVDGTTAGTGGYEETELWTSTGTAGGTTQVFVPTLAGGAHYAPSVEDLTVSNGHLFFVGDNGLESGTSAQLYVSDGTTSGTHLLDPAVTATSGGATHLTDVNGTLYFDMNDGTDNVQLWKSDGTEAGTTMVTDINPGGSGFTGFNFVTAANGTIYFVGNDATHGQEIWKTDGTGANTVLVDDINPSGTGVYSGADLTVIGNELYFFADDVTHGEQLWKTDGTAANTQMVDLAAGISQPTDLQAIDGTLYFVAAEGGKLGLFKSDGTTITEIANNFSGLSSGDPEDGGTIGAFITLDEAPSVSSLVAAATSGADLSAAHTVTFTLDASKDVDAAPGTTLLLSDGGTATYASGWGTPTLTFTYSATDAPSSSLTVSSVSAGSLTDSSGSALPVTGTAVTTYTDAVSDLAANVSAQFDNLDAIVSHITTITLTDGGTPDLDLTVSQTLNDTTLIGKIVSAYDLVVHDSVVDVQINIAALDADESNISAISFTNGGVPTLTLSEAQVSAYGPLLAKIQGPYDLHMDQASGTTPESGLTGVGPQFNAVDYIYNGSSELTETIYHNTDGSTSYVEEFGGQTIDDSASTTNSFYELSNGNATTVIGGSGAADIDDSFYFGAAFAANDNITGGSGDDNQIGLEGDYSGGLTLGPDTITNIQVIACEPGFNYNLTTNDGNVADDQNLTIWAANLASTNTLHFNGSAETNGFFTIYGGAGNDTLIGGADGSTFYGDGGADTMTGGAGTDFFNYSKPSDSTSTAYDTITNFDASLDGFNFLGAPVNSIDTAIVTGSLSTATFDSDLTAALSGHLAAHHAILFTPNAGTLSGQTFLIVDANGTAGYQAGHDYVIDITGATNLASLSTGDFGT